MIRQSDYENYDYRQFWEDDKRAYEDNAERIAIKKLFKGISQEGKVFADLGCGFGRLFKEYAGFDIIILVDYSISNLKSARKSVFEYLKKEKNLQAFNKVLFIAADVNNLPLKDSILDVCMTVRVIHHLVKPAIFFTEVSRVIRPGGIFFLEFANKRNLKNILKFFTRRSGKSPFDSKPLQVGDTILDYHPAYIGSLLKNARFKIARRLSVSNFRLDFLKKHVNLRILLFFEKLYQDLFSFAGLGPSIFLKTVFAQKDIITEGNAGSRTLISGHKELHKELLQCPSCGSGSLLFKESNNQKIIISGEIEAEYKKLPGNEISCSNCGRKYPVIDGIMVFKK